MESKGDQLMAEGEKALKKFTLFSGSDEKVDRAHEKFLLAATQYKACGSFAKAAQAYKRAADMSGKAKNDGERAVELEESGKASVKAEDSAAALEAFKRVVDLYDQAQKYVNAARTCGSIADISEGQEALAWLEKAVKYYKMQGSKVTAAEIVVKIADVKAKTADYEGAREMYEQLARDALDDRLARVGARKLFFAALLAQIAMMTSGSLMEDVGALEERFHEYEDLDTQFNHLTREHMVITAVIDAIQGEDAEKYAEAVKEYVSICPLEPFKLKMLNHGKEALESLN